MKGGTKVETTSNHESIPLWPGPAPGSEGWAQVEVLDPDPISGTAIISNVVIPTITAVLPEPGMGNGAAVVVAPGGAFSVLAWEHEGLDVARWFAERGTAAFVLKYRLRRTPPDANLVEEFESSMPDPASNPAGFRMWFADAAERYAAFATADAEQALRLVRQRAATFGIDATRVGILGFSAGGTVALRAAATPDPAARPDFVVSVYGSFIGRGVPIGAPPCYLAVAADDSLALDWCMEAARTWARLGAPVELHMYESGGHGFGLGHPGSPSEVWTEHLRGWLSSRNFC